MGYLLGLCAFALFFLNDYNDWRLGWKALNICFPIGAVLLVIGTVVEISRGESLAKGWLRGGFIALAVLFLTLLVYTLFFAIPVEASYTRPGEKRNVCTKGVYALCRHPGVLWFIGLYLCLWIAAGVPLWEAATFSILNVCLVWFEDRCVFSEKLEGYDAYRKVTPFLLPTGQSIRDCIKTI